MVVDNGSCNCLNEDGDTMMVIMVVMILDGHGCSHRDNDTDHYFQIPLYK